MKHYRKSIAGLNYTTQNMAGSPKTHVFIENHPNPYFFYAPKREWVVQPNYSGAPDLPVEQLEALEDALVKHEEERLKAITEANERFRHRNKLIEDDSTIVEICTVHDGSFSTNENEPPKLGLTFAKGESAGAWLTYVVEHSPGRVKQVKRRLPDIHPLSPASKEFEAKMQEEYEFERMVDKSIRNPVHHFEAAQQNAAGVALNKQVTAVYELSGYIHETLRNHPDYPKGKPHWQYIRQDGTLTKFESEVSALDVRKKLIESTQVKRRGSR